MIQTAILFAMVAAISYSVACRLRHTDSQTSTIIKLQHCLLNAAALFSLVVPPDWSGVMLAAGVAVFLVLGAPRWRHGVPGTQPPRVYRHPWAG